MRIVDVAVENVLIRIKLVVGTRGHEIRANSRVLIEIISLINGGCTAIDDAGPIAGLVPDIAACSGGNTGGRNSVLRVGKFAREIVTEQVLGLRLTLLLARDRGEQ